MFPVVSGLVQTRLIRFYLLTASPKSSCDLRRHTLSLALPLGGKFGTAKRRFQPNKSATDHSAWDTGPGSE